MMPAMNQFQGAGRPPGTITRPSDAYPPGPDPAEVRALRRADRRARRRMAADIEQYGDLTPEQLAQVRDAEFGDWADGYEE